MQFRGNGRFLSKLLQNVVLQRPKLGVPLLFFGMILVHGDVDNGPRRRAGRQQYGWKLNQVGAFAEQDLLLHKSLIAVAQQTPYRHARICATL